jgi:hypothetical protein
VAFCLFPCGIVLAQAVRTSYRPGIDFTKYHTYKWISVKGGQHPDPAVDAQIKQSIESQLARKALTKGGDTADLAVDYQLALSEAQVWQTYEDWTATGLMDQRLPQQKQVTIELGTLVLDIYDPATKQLIWTGRANKTIDRKSSPQERQKAFNNAAEKMLKPYPPK